MSLLAARLRGAVPRRAGRPWRRAALTVWLALLPNPAPAPAGASETGADPPGERLPNIVFIVADDQGFGDFGFMGHAEIETPRLDRLAAESLVFTRGYVAASRCRPSLASIATGLYPHQHRISTNDPPRLRDLVGPNKSRRLRRQSEEMAGFIEEVPTLPRLLASKGYRSFQSGKWWEGHYRRGGFTRGMTQRERSQGGREGDEGLRIGRETMQPLYDFVAEAGEDPFLIWYAPLLPHLPHTPPQRLLDKYLAKTPSVHLARYWATIEWFDETCGELLDHLEERGLSERTLVVFIVDNGWIQSPSEALGSPRGKGSPYEAGIRTPILLRWPGVIEPRRDETPVASIDLVPTVLASLGLEAGERMQGIDLFDRAAVAKRGAVFGEVFVAKAVDILDPVANLLYRWSVSGRWKLVLPNPTLLPDASAELFDLAADPRETTNVAASHVAIARSLRERIDEWWLPK